MIDKMKQEQSNLEQEHQIIKDLKDTEIFKFRDKSWKLKQETFGMECIDDSIDKNLNKEAVKMNKNLTRNNRNTETKWQVGRLQEWGTIYTQIKSYRTEEGCFNTGMPRSH